jgi:hypothetical protein
MSLSASTAAPSATTDANRACDGLLAAHDEHYLHFRATPHIFAAVRSLGYVIVEAPPAQGEQPPKNSAELREYMRERQRLHRQRKKREEAKLHEEIETRFRKLNQGKEA